MRVRTELGSGLKTKRKRAGQHVVACGNKLELKAEKESKLWNRPKINYKQKEKSEIMTNCLKDPEHLIP